MNPALALATGALVLAVGCAKPASGVSIDARQGTPGDAGSGDGGASDANASSDGAAVVSCTGVAPAGLTRELQAEVQFFPSPASLRDVTSYVAVYSYDPANPDPWPGNGGIKPFIGSRYQSGANPTFVALGFVPGTELVAPHWFNVGSAAPLASFTVSECPGDFGGPSTHLADATYCSCDAVGGCSGFVADTDPTVPYTCHVTPGKQYYLNAMNAALESPTVSTCSDMVNCKIQLEMTR